MKKVLILAYDFPPYVSVGGLRPFNWYKYFKDFDIEPIVITRQWDNTYGNSLDYIAPSKEKKTVIDKTAYGTIIRSPYFPNLSNRILLKHGENRFRLLRKMITAYYEFAQYFYTVGPKKEVYLAAQEYLKNNQVDAILATGDPFVLFEYASKLSTQFNTPWIADYRDPWSQYEDVQKNPFLRRFHESAEKRAMKNVSQITTVSEFLEAKIKSLGINQKIHILPNGYDPELIENSSRIKPSTSQLEIGFVGTIYEWHPWRSFLRVLKQVLTSDPTIQIRLYFYGVNESEQIQSFIQDECKEIAHTIEFTPRIPNKEVLEKLARHNLMLLFNYYSYMGTKIFDYIGLKRKMILCYSNDPEAFELKEKYYNIEEISGVSKTLQTDLIEETNSGVVVENAVHLKQVLIDLWDEFKTSGEIACHSQGVENFSRKIQVGKLATIIKTLK